MASLDWGVLQQKKDSSNFLRDFHFSSGLIVLKEFVVFFRSFFSDMKARYQILIKLETVSIGHGCPRQNAIQKKVTYVIVTGAA